MYLVFRVILEPVTLIPSPLFPGLNEAGVILDACKACADRYGVSEHLECLGVTVRYMGIPLTEYLKEGQRVITF